MDIAYKKVVWYGVAGAVGDTLGHAFGGTVCEGETQHVFIFHPCLMGMHDTFGQDIGFAASWRCQYKMSSPLYLNGFLLPDIKLSFH